MHALPVFLLLAGLVLVHSNNLRGVNPEVASQYTGGGGTFTCISGIPRTIPFSRVNDDYCDCPDGSDEPGTSACHNGRFYCRNLGHEPRLLASAFVDDGVCDCCDGADEPKGKCQNTCLQAAAVKKEALRGKIQLHEIMLNTKKEYVAKAGSFKEELKLKAQTIDEDIARQQAEVENLKGEVTRLEAEEAAAEAARQAEAAAANQALEEARKAEDAQQAAAKAEESASAQAEDAAGSEDGQYGTEGEEAQPEEREETPEERGRRIASQWTNDPEAAAVQDFGDHVNEDEQESEDEGHYDNGGDDGEGHFDYQHNAEAPPPEYHAEQHRRTRPDLTTPLGQARSAVFAAERTLQQLEKDKANIGTYLHRPLDFGPGDIFLALANKCFTSYQTRWTYEVCMFDKATQKEGYTNSVTIGRWYGFSDDYKSMFFTGGDECWGVGPRSMTVSLVCGYEERLSDGEEPSTCAYSAKLTTPAVCTEAELQVLQQELDNLEAFEKEVQAQIQKDEL